MRHLKSFAFTFVLIFPLIVYGQNNASEHDEYEPIESYNLRKAIIYKQKLDVWPTILEIKSLTELNKALSDSLILFFAETDDGDKIRLSSTHDLSKFSEKSYSGGCDQYGTILADLKFGKISLVEMKAEILCQDEKFTELEIVN
jgi:hypothetical protein